MNEGGTTPTSTGNLSETSIEAPGASVGRYKLLQQIGEGGCGIVFTAEQEEPLRRTVALKVIKPGMDTRNVIARFEAERQALALMDHPNIARVIDAGATTNGRPYFVMELVEGPKITDYCDQHSLSTAERLRLFMQICSAVQHAHQKGIIHRDIKPSNILVTTSTEGKPLPKVIDFGIAKATTGLQLTDKTLFTPYDMLIGTPTYMSPEQADFTSIDIDTRSDIYSMGVLLYELLTGTTPFDTQELLKAGLDEVRRVIRTRDPVRPSTRLGTMAVPDLTSTSQRRRTHPPTLVREVRGDLDWIVMKAMEKDRSRRYATANALGLDVARFLAKEGVLARPPNALYQLQKLFLRNRLMFIVGSVIFLLLIVALGVTTRLVVLQRHELREADAMRWETKAIKFAREGKPSDAKAALLESLAVRKKYLGGDPPAVETMRPIIGSMMGTIPGINEGVKLLDQILTPAVVAQPEFGDFMVMRTELRGWQGRWLLALSDAEFLVRQQPDNNYRYPALAALLVATTNLNAYQNLCSNSLVHFSKTTNVFVADQTAKDCLILPSAGVDLKSVLALTTFAVTTGKNESLAYPNFQCCHALAQYRIGNCQEAITWAQESAKHQLPEFQAEAYAVLAMAQQKLGNKNEARQALTNCTRVIETKLPKLGEWLGKDWKDWIFAHALEAEAKQLIDGPAPSPAQRAEIQH